MTTATVSGHGRAVGVFDLNPEFVVQERRVRRAEQSPVEAGMWQRHQSANSVGETSLRGEVREWTLRWKMATKAEADTMRSYYQQAKGNAGLLLYYPPDETALSNLCPAGDSLISPTWKRESTLTTVSTNAATPPTGATQAYALVNGTGATAEGVLSVQAGRYPSSGTLFTVGCYTQYHSAAGTPGTTLTLRVRNASTGDEHGAVWAYATGVWGVTASSSAVTPVTYVDGAWTRMLLFMSAGSGTIGTYPDKRYIEITQGTPATPSADGSTLHAGFSLEEAKVITDLSGVSTYTAERKHVLVRIMDAPLRIERFGPQNYKMEITLREVPSAP